MKSRFLINIEKGNNIDWRPNIYCILINISVFQINAINIPAFCHWNTEFLHASQM
jgi:hypothetical protein